MIEERMYGRVKIVGEEFHIDMEPHVRMRFKRIFERVSKLHAGDTRLTITDQNCRELEWFTQLFPLEMAPDVAEVVSEGRWAYLRRQQTMERIRQNRYVPGTYELALPLRPYQNEAVDMAMASGHLLIGDDVGLGKTPQGIAVFSEPHCRPALVVTLTHLPIQWAHQIQKFLPGMRTHILRSTQVYDLEVNRHGYPMPFPDVIICNYSKLRFWADELAGVVKTVVYDEIQELRRADSQKYSAAQGISEEAAYQVGLTATPIYNFGIEVFNVLNALCPGMLGSKEEFGREWCGGEWGDKARIEDPRAFGKFLREEGHMVRRTRKDVGRELPACQIVSHWVSPDMFHLEKVSDEVAEMARLLLSEGGTGLEKMKAAGDMDYRLRRATGMSKALPVAAFVKLMIENGEKVVLFGWHRDVYEIWKTQLAEFDPGWITGSETPAQKELHKQRFIEGSGRALMKAHGGGGQWVDYDPADDMARFMKCRGTDLLIMSLRSGAGIDGLQHVCSVGVIGELDWSPGVHTQCIGRIYRDGQESPVLIYVILTEEGSDPVMMDVCQLKKMQLDGINDPDADDLVEELQVNTDRMKVMARAYLAKRGEDVLGPEPSPSSDPMMDEAMEIVASESRAGG